MRRAPEPYTLAYVTLAKDRGCDQHRRLRSRQAKIGQAVHVGVQPSKEGALVPVWTPD